MMKHVSTLLAMILLLTLCMFGVTASGASEAPLAYSLGDKIHDFTFSTHEGQEVTLSEVLKEKEAVLINIWATWCGPCRNEFPYLEEAYQQYQDQVEVIALSCEPTDTADVLAAFAAEMGLTFKIGQDPVDFLSALGVSSIPTSLIVDRYGTICFIQSGAQPNTESFTRLFEAFLGDDYRESVLLDDIPPMKPTVVPFSEEALSAALGATAANPSYAYTWPMIVTEVDGRNVVVSTNKSVSSTDASVTAAVSANAGDAIVITFKTSTEAVFDLLSISVDGTVVKSFTGEHDWTTYAVQATHDGEHTVTLSYIKNVTADGGEDAVWIDSIEVVSGDAAAAALAANPAYPSADSSSITVVSPEAKEIAITDPTGLLANYFGDVRYWIVNTDQAEFFATLDGSFDPETSFFFCNYDGKITGLTQGITDGGYKVSSGVDSVETTGYAYAAMSLYPDASGIGVQSIIFFKDEANVDLFVNRNLINAAGAVVGSWHYADGSVPGSAAVDDGLSDYTLKCIDQDGNPVSGVMLQVCDDSTCQVFVSDDNGLYAFTAVPYAWEVHILKAPEGYTADTVEVMLAPVDGGEMIFTLTKK